MKVFPFVKTISIIVTLFFAAHASEAQQASKTLSPPHGVPKTSAQESVSVSKACTGNPLCMQSGALIATLTHFDFLGAAGAHEWSLQAHIRNNGTRTLILGTPIDEEVGKRDGLSGTGRSLIRAKSQLTDDQQASYQLMSTDGLAAGPWSPTLTLLPGQSSDLRLQFMLKSNSAFGTTFSFRLNLQELEIYQGTPSNSLTDTVAHIPKGHSEYAFLFKDIVPGTVANSPSPGNDHCLTYADCYDGGSFVAAVTGISRTDVAVRFTLKLINVSGTPLTLTENSNGLKAFDELHTVFRGGLAIGIPLTNGSQVIPATFVLNPRQSKTVMLVAAVPAKAARGAKYSLLSTIEEIETDPQKKLGYRREVPMEFSNLDIASISPASITVGASLSNIQDNCRELPHCVDAGPYVVNIDELSQIKTPAGVPGTQLRLKFTNSGSESIRLGYEEQGLLALDTSIDNLGNHFALQRVDGMGRVAVGAADPSFVLAAGASRVATFIFSKQSIGTQNPMNKSQLGSVFDLNPVIFELSIMPNGEQIKVGQMTLLNFSGITLADPSTQPITATAKTTPVRAAAVNEPVKSETAIVSSAPGTKGSITQAIEAKYLKSPSGQKSKIAIDLLKGGLMLGNSQPDLMLSDVSNYNDGTYTPDAATANQLQRSAGYFRSFTAGERLTVMSVTVRNDGVMLEFLSDPINNVRYAGYIKYPFPKGAYPSPQAMLERIGETITTEPGSPVAP